MRIYVLVTEGKVEFFKKEMAQALYSKAIESDDYIDYDTWEEEIARPTNINLNSVGKEYKDIKANSFYDWLVEKMGFKKKHMKLFGPALKWYETEWYIEDIEQLKDDIVAYLDLSRRNLITGVDVNKITYAQLKDHIDTANKKKNQVVLDAKLEAELLRDGKAEIIHEDGRWKIVKLNAKSAAIYFGLKTRWCTARNDDHNAFAYYHDTQDIWVAFDKKKVSGFPKMQLSIHRYLRDDINFIEEMNIQFMDPRDVPVEDTAIKNEIIRICRPDLDIPSGENNLACDVIYADALQNTTRYDFVRLSQRAPIFKLIEFMKIQTPLPGAARYWKTIQQHAAEDLFPSRQRVDGGAAVRQVIPTLPYEMHNVDNMINSGHSSHRMRNFLNALKRSENNEKERWDRTVVQTLKLQPIMIERAEQALAEEHHSARVREQVEDIRDRWADISKEKFDDFFAYLYETSKQLLEIKIQIHDKETDEWVKKNT